MDKVPLTTIDSLTVTVLMENTSDLLLPDQPPAHRPGFVGGPTLDASVFEGPGPDVVIAEHGFSALVAIGTGGRDHTVLFDTGISPYGMVENMRRLDVDPKDVGSLVLSHGHLDHTGGLLGFIQAVGRANLPVLLHPDFWLRRRLAPPGADPIEIPTTSRRALEDGGFDIIEEGQPSFLLDGMLLVTGEVDRTTSFEAGFPIHQAFRGGAWTPDPLILDDQALIAHVAGKGLVIITGCGHSGIVNVVRYAQRLTGISDVHAIIGGFHLSGGLFEPIVQTTIEALAEIGPDVVFPGHCTGWKAQHALADKLPNAYIHPSVGTRLELSGA